MYISKKAASFVDMQRIPVLPDPVLHFFSPFRRKKRLILELYWVFGKKFSQEFLFCSLAIKKLANTIFPEHSVDLMQHPVVALLSLPDEQLVSN